MSNTSSHNEEFEKAQQRIEQLEKDKHAFQPQMFDSEFAVSQDLGANYYRKFKQAFKDFCTTFQLPFTELVVVEEDKIGGNYLSQAKSNDSLIVFKLTNRFPPLAQQKSAQLDIVVAQSANQHIPNKFNLRFTQEENRDSFNLNLCTVIVFDEPKLATVIQKAKFWVTLATL